MTRRRSWAAVRRRRVVKGTATEAGGMCAVPPWVQRGSVRHRAQVSVRIVGDLAGGQKKSEWIAEISILSSTTTLLN